MHIGVFKSFAFCASSRPISVGRKQFLSYLWVLFFFGACLGFDAPKNISANDKRIMWDCREGEAVGKQTSTLLRH